MAAIVSGGWQRPPVSCKNPLISHSQGQILCSCAVCHRRIPGQNSWERKLGQTCGVSEWSVLTRSIAVCSWNQIGHKWIILIVKSWNNNCSCLHAVPDALTWGFHAPFCLPQLQRGRPAALNLNVISLLSPRPRAAFPLCYDKILCF